MILDGAVIPGLPNAKFTLCIIGSGPVGLTIANELRDIGARVCVVESGDRKRTVRGRSLSEVEYEGIPIRPSSRERILGGASTTWSGLSSPLDEVDMKARPAVDYPGWPISREELTRYWEKASARYGFPPMDSFEEEGWLATRRQGDRHLKWTTLTEKIFLAAETPLNFGVHFEHLFNRPLGFDIYLNTTLVRLLGKEGSQHISSGIFRTSSGHSLIIEADLFVLATGGIDNPRILLNSKDSCPMGTGNENDQVGRYLMNHPKGRHGIIRLRRPVRELPLYFGCLQHCLSGYAGLRMKHEIQERRGLLNSYVRFEPLYEWSEKPGVEWLIKWIKNGWLSRQWRNSHRDKLISIRAYAETGDNPDFEREGDLRTLATCIRDSPYMLKYAFYRGMGWPGPAVTRIRLRNFMEMEPNADNRILLSSRLDSLGQAIPKVRHQTTELDRRSLIELHRLLAEEVKRNGFGELCSDLSAADPWPISDDASHYLGTTRMGHDERKSVVNVDGRLHTVKNVYLAGGSIFPTSGCANPTFTMIALAIRLSEHLRRELTPEVVEVRTSMKNRMGIPSTCRTAPGRPS